MENKVGRSLPIGGVGLGELSRPRRSVDTEYIPFHQHKACPYVLQHYGSRFHCLCCPLPTCIYDLTDGHQQQIEERNNNGEQEHVCRLLHEGVSLKKINIQTEVPIRTIRRWRDEVCRQLDNLSDEG